jgi:predicted transcriptional regulator
MGDITMRRSRIDIICAILSALENGALKPTPLMYKSNLSHELFVKYVQELETAGLIKKTGMKTGITYMLTEQGIRYVQEYHRFLKFSSSFGL